MREKMRKLIVAFLTVCMLISINNISVLAQEMGGNRVIILNDMKDLKQYNGADGIYKVRLDNGNWIEITINTTDIADSRMSVYASETIQKKSYEYKYTYSNGDLIWKTKVTGTFHFDKTYVWCTYGIAEYDIGDRDHSSISFSENTYSSAKVTGVSKYQIKAKITTPAGTYNITQYVGSDPSGPIYYDMSH